MQILINILLITVVLLSACTPRAPLTPEDAFSRIRRAWMTKNGSLMADNLSEESRGRIRKAARLVEALSPEQKNHLVTEYGLTLEKDGTVSVQGYCAMMVEKESKSQPALSVRKEIGSIDVKDNKAVITMVDGFSYTFVKEGPYWRYLLP